MVESLKESAWRRGWNDTKSQWANWTFVIINTIASILLFLFGLFVFAWYWGVGLLVAPAIGVWVYETILATRKQRNEAIERVALLQEEAAKKRDASAGDEKLKLKGKFFHDFDKEGDVQHQGQIIDFLNDDTVIIQYFDFMTGAPSKTKIVWLKDIVEGGWALYTSYEEMRDAYEHENEKRRRR